jgi:hypothetical protein
MQLIKDLKSIVNIVETAFETEVKSIKYNQRVFLANRRFKKRTCYCCTKSFNPLNSDAILLPICFGCRQEYKLDQRVLNRSALYALLAVTFFSFLTPPWTTVIIGLPIASLALLLPVFRHRIKLWYYQNKEVKRNTDPNWRYRPWGQKTMMRLRNLYRTALW